MPRGCSGQGGALEGPPAPGGRNRGRPGLPRPGPQLPCPGSHPAEAWPRPDHMAIGLPRAVVLNPLASPGLSVWRRRRHRTITLRSARLAGQGVLTPRGAGAVLTTPPLSRQRNRGPKRRGAGLPGLWCESWQEWGSLDGPIVPSEQDSLCLEMSATRKQGCGISQGLEGGPWCLAEFECSLILGHASASPPSCPLPLLSPPCPLSIPQLQSPLRFAGPALRGVSSVLTIGAQRGPDLGRRAAPTQSPTYCGVSAQRPWPAGSCPSGELSIRRPPTSPALPHTFAQARPFMGTPSSAQGSRLGGLEGLEKSSKPRV